MCGFASENRPSGNGGSSHGNRYLTDGRDFSTLTSSDTALNEAIEKYNIKENYDKYYPMPITQKEIID